MIDRHIRILRLMAQQRQRELRSYEASQYDGHLGSPDDRQHLERERQLEPARAWPTPKHDGVAATRVPAAIPQTTLGTTYAPGDDTRSEIAMAFTIRKDKVREAESPEHSGGWYADPYGAGARRWFDTITGWSKRVEGAGQAPDKTGLARMDEAAVTSDDAPRPVDEHGRPVPLSRPVDPKYMADARPVR